MNMHSGNTVERLRGSLEGTMKKGGLYTIKQLIDEQYMTLVEVEGQYLRSEFKVKVSENPKELLPMTELERVHMALTILKTYNAPRDPNLQISIQADIPQRGGDSYMIGDYDTNSIDALIDHLSRYESNKDKSVVMQRAASIMAAMED